MNNRIKDTGLPLPPDFAKQVYEAVDLEAFVNAVEDMVCEAMGEGLLEGKLFGINITVNPETQECRIWRCDD